MIETIYLTGIQKQKTMTCVTSEDLDIKTIPQDCDITSYTMYM